MRLPDGARTRGLQHRDPLLHADLARRRIALPDSGLRPPERSVEADPEILQPDQEVDWLRGSQGKTRL